MVILLSLWCSNECVISKITFSSSHRAATKCWVQCLWESYKFIPATQVCHDTVEYYTVRTRDIQTPLLALSLPSSKSSFSCDVVYSMVLLGCMGWVDWMGCVQYLTLSLPSSKSSFSRGVVYSMVLLGCMGWVDWMGCVKYPTLSLPSSKSSFSRGVVYSMVRLGCMGWADWTGVVHYNPFTPRFKKCVLPIT